MSIVGGLDVHRAQIRYDYLEVETGEVEVGRIVSATRPVLRDWLSRFEGQEAVFATEGCTGWRFVIEETLRRASRRTWRSRRTPPPCEVARSGPRRIGPTPAISAPCW